MSETRINNAAGRYLYKLQRQFGRNKQIPLQLI